MSVEFIVKSYYEPVYLCERQNVDVGWWIIP